MTRAAYRALCARADEAWRLVRARREGLGPNEPGAPYFVAIEMVMDGGVERSAAMRLLRGAFWRSILPPLMHRRTIAYAYQRINWHAPNSVLAMRDAVLCLAEALRLEEATARPDMPFRILEWRRETTRSLLLLAELEGIKLDRVGL